jgi:hypothetical protein
MEREEDSGRQRGAELRPGQRAPLTPATPDDEEPTNDDQRQPEPPDGDGEGMGVRESRERPAERDGDDREREAEPRRHDAGV